MWPPTPHGSYAPSRAFQSTQQLPVSVFSRGPQLEVDRSSVESDHIEYRAPRTGEARGHREPVPTTRRRPRGEAGVWLGIKKFLKVSAMLLVTRICTRSRRHRLYHYRYSPFRSPPSFLFLFRWFGFGGSAHVHYTLLWASRWLGGGEGQARAGLMRLSLVDSGTIRPCVAARPSGLPQWISRVGAFRPAGIQ